MSKDNVDINTVDQSVLESIEGVGTGFAARIIDYRDRNGEFKAWDDLRKVPGMTKSLIEVLKQHGVTLGRKAA